MVVNLDNKVKCHPPDGLKLLENCWQSGFYFINAALSPGEWAGDRIVWLGDYSEDSFEVDEKVMTAGEILNEFPDIKLSKKIEESKNMIETPVLVNYNRKKWIYIDFMPECEDKPHPLPFLTASGNGLGGGDYRGHGYWQVGQWAGDRVAMIDVASVPSDFTEIKLDFEFD